MQAPTAASEIHLIETFADTRVIGVTLNHENMSVAEVDLAVDEYRAELGVPVTDALLRPPRELVDMVVAAFPALEEQLTAVV
jgi:uncharacterized NAD-dependent epimerase/dehydratase family protein